MINEMVNSQHNHSKKTAEERAQLFLQQHPISITKSPLPQTIQSQCTLRDSLALNASNSYLSTNARASIYDERMRQSTLGLQNTFKVPKNLTKYIEPRRKVSQSYKLDPKFFPDTSVSCSKQYKHDLTYSENDLFEIDEKIPQTKYDILAQKREFFLQDSCSFGMFIQINKIYIDMINDLKINELKNEQNKERISVDFLSFMLSEDNNLGESFQFNKPMNKFLMRQFCLFLIMLYIKEFKSLSFNEVMEFHTGFAYAHTNYLFMLMIIIKNYSNDQVINVEALQEDENYMKCVALVEEQKKKEIISEEKFTLLFKRYNKILKNVLSNLICTLQSPICLDQNDYKTLSMLKLCAKSMKSQFRKFRNEIQDNNYIMAKYNSIYTQLHIITETDDDIHDDYENDVKAQVPFLPAKKIDDKREYTLVIDLDETLVHYFEEEGGENAYVKVRVGCENFITKLSEYCEIVIFTAGIKFYADIVIQGLDSKDKIDYRLYRQHTDVVDGINVKDLSKLGRDLSKVVIVDNIKENFQRQPENGLHIIDFEGDENDQELIYLLEDLLQLFSKSGIDVRNYLNPIREKMEQRYAQ